MGKVIEQHDLVERIFLPWRLKLGDTYEPYKGHVYRVLNYSCAILDLGKHDLSSYGSRKEVENQIAVAACFHDVAIWLDGTMDYLEPSVNHAVHWLTERGHQEWTDAVTRMISYHHKSTPYRDDQEALVETFRRADLVDVTMGWQRCGIDGDFIREVHQQFPYRGFHWLVAKGIGGWMIKHPLNPVPMMKR